MIPQKPILIMSNAIVDDIWFADGIRHAYTLGGAALYAAVAASMWWDNVAVVSGVGADFEQIAGAALTSHNLRREGLVTLLLIFFATFGRRFGIHTTPSVTTWALLCGNCRATPPRLRTSGT